MNAYHHKVRYSGIVLSMLCDVWGKKKTKFIPSTMQYVRDESPLTLFPA